MLVPHLRRWRGARLPLTALGTLLLSAAGARAESWVRYNQAGYTPDRPKQLLVMSDAALDGQPWIVQRDGAVVLEGAFGESVAAAGPHTPLPFNYSLDLTALGEVGSYELTVPEAAPVTLRVSENPYGFLINQVLRHLRVARSGTDDTLLHPASHLGDASAPLYRIAGDPADGAWEPDPSGENVDMLGGWYDAGDYIKFTLTNAYTTYFLLRAYAANPSAFTKELSTSALVDVLDEAKFGLDYLMKTYPSEDVFVIQVSTGADHQVGYRLPQNDTRDGEREALAALSPTHMAYTAAALARGAQVFRDVGQEELAASYGERAVAIWNRMRQPDVLTESAFERDPANDFYRDQTIADNVALAAVELYGWSGDASYLDAARSERSTGGYWASWGNVDVFANLAIGEHDGAAASDAASELAYFIGNGRAAGNVWNTPLQYTWASLTNWMGVGSAAGLAARGATPPDGTQELYWSMLDYTLGKNNWGLAMIASEDLPASIRNIYSQIYTLTGEFPTGAVSEGPGDRETHDQMQQWFSGPLDTSLEAFNTDAAVFYDDEKDFMTQEAVIVGQAQAVLLLALASEGPPGAGPVTGGNDGSPSTPGAGPSSGEESGCACRTAGALGRAGDGGWGGLAAGWLITAAAWLRARARKRPLASSH
jgi:hypothetical protein